MTIREAHIPVTRTARYFLLGEIGEQLKEVWFVCHGQGQLGNYFIKHFETISAPHRLIVAPEGLSRFYLDGMGGRVGAIWMTREDRLNEIQDYLNYLDQLYQEIFTQLDRNRVKVHVLGFSQGVATVSRWVGLGKARAEYLTLWAGQLPPDLDLAARREVFQRLQLSIVIGNQDQFADESFIESEVKRLTEHSLEHRLIRFEGAHVLNGEVLAELAARGEKNS